MFASRIEFRHTTGYGLRGPVVAKNPSGGSGSGVRDGEGQSDAPDRRGSAPEGRGLDAARDRGIAIQCHVRAVLVVVGRVGSNQTKQVTLAEHDHVVENLSPERADEPLRVSVLPRRAWARS